MFLITLFGFVCFLLSKELEIVMKLHKEEDYMIWYKDDDLEAKKWEQKIQEAYFSIVCNL